MQHELYYKIGLPSSIRFRSQLIFGMLAILFLSFFASGIYAGVKSGRLEEAIVKPLGNFVKALQTEKEYSGQSQVEEYPSFTATSSSEVNIEINFQESNYQTPSNRSYNTPYVYPTIKYKSYSEIKKDQDEWWAKVQNQNRQLSDESKRQLEQFRQQSQQNLKKFEQQGQTGLEQFRQESERKIEEFNQKYGIK